METKYLFSSDNYFNIVDFSLSHRILLLRSSNSFLLGDEVLNTNIDVAFMFVSYMEIVPNIEGLNIRLASADEKYVLEKRIFIEEGKRLFVITGNQEQTYYVICGVLQIYKNNLPIDETSIGLKRNLEYVTTFSKEDILNFS
jgi:hypothetical protein